MDWKKRGIQLKSLRPDDPGHLNLCKVPGDGEGPEAEPPAETVPWEAAMENTWTPEDEPSDEPVHPLPQDLPPHELSRAIREELEEALSLLDDAIEAAQLIPLRE
ncbi:MAG: hypothetical protein PVF91_08530 [Chromatiales bacterium]|jgi:hypothetical protein